MKFTLFLAGLALLICFAQAEPEGVELQVLPLDPGLITLEDDNIPILHSRHKRYTCDLLSYWDVKHTPCAAACLAQNYKGGACQSNGECKCRR